jgi:hypothetical protein
MMAMKRVPHPEDLLDENSNLRKGIEQMGRASKLPAVRRILAAITNDQAISNSRSRHKKRLIRYQCEN